MGTLIEGETVLLVAGALASRGVLNPAAVWIVAACGDWLGHVIWFGVGRLVGRERILAVLPQWGRQLDALDGLIRRRSWTLQGRIGTLEAQQLESSIVRPEILEPRPHPTLPWALAQEG
jgi:hypothetical protein